MKKINKLPTILGVLILFFGMVAGIYLINSTQIFKLSANTEAVPKNVRFTNITDSNITVTWTTDIESNGFVKWGNSNNILNKVALEESADKSFIHSANIIGSTTNQDVYLKINSQGKDYGNQGVAWQSKTSGQKISQENSLIASGTVLKQDGSSPEKAIVYLTVNGVVISSVTSDKGSFIIPISNYVDKIIDTNVIDISINNGNGGMSQIMIYPQAVKSIPTIIIGKTYDFRSLVGNESNDLPTSSISIPESIEISSRFEVQKEGNNTPTSTVTIESINNGEIITTNDPEFFGKGPQNTNIEISVESELQQGTLTTDSKGSWKWSPPNNLEPGEHKMTVKWRDADGILRTISRSFVVQASEGPAFESTPSATPTEQAVSSTATPKSSKTPVATAQPTPETGSLIPTLGLFMMGIGILFSSVYIWNKSNVY